jgi:hypothetical protein
MDFELTGLSSDGQELIAGRVSGWAFISPRRSLRHTAAELR